VFARDAGCRFPGCRAPVAWCDIHHVHERATGGDHHLSNLLALCRRHHVVVHRRGWIQHLEPDGTYTITRNQRSWTTRPRLTDHLPPPGTHPHGTDPPGTDPPGTDPPGADPPDPQPHRARAPAARAPHPADPTPPTPPLTIPF
jgi:hypothetical protein